MNVCSISFKRIKEVPSYENFYNTVINYSGLLNPLVQFVQSQLNEGGLDAESIQDLLSHAKNTLEQENSVQEKINNVQYIIDNLSNLIVSQKNATITDKKAQLDFGRTDMFLPILNAELNNAEESVLRNEAFKMSYYNPERGIVVPSELKYSILDYKNNLYKQLCQYLGKPQKNFIKSDGTLINVFTYQNLMKEAWNKLQKDAYGLQKASLTDPRTQRTLRYLEAFYVLNNFDNWIKWASNGTIVIDPTQDGSISSTDNKYKMLDQQKVNSSYEGTHADQDASKQESKIFKSFWATIDNGHNGKCSENDFRKLCSGVQTVLNSESSELDFLIDPTLTTREFLDELNKNKSLLKSLISNNQIIDNLIDALEKFDKHFIEASKDLNIKDQVDLQQKLNFISQFKQELLLHCNKTYIASEDGKILIKSQVGIKKSKEFLTNQMQKKLLDNVQKLNFAVYRPTFTVNVEGKYVFSDNFKDNLYDMFGFYLTPETLSKFNVNDENAEILWKFLNSYVSLVNSSLIPTLRKNNFRDQDVIVADFMNKVKHTQEFVMWSNVIVEDNENDTVKLLDQAGNSQPISGTPNTLQNFKRNVKKFSEQFENTENILIKYPNLYSKTKNYSDNYREHIAYRQDVKVDDKVIKAHELSPLGSAQVAFNNEFINSILEENTFFNQVDCYSDKVTIALTALNVMAEGFQTSAGQGTLLDLNADEVRNLWFKQKQSYYQNIRNQIIDDLSKVFGVTNYSYSLESLNSLIKTLEGYSETDFIKKVYDYNKNHQSSPIDVVREVHYCVQKGKCVFNNSLYFNIRETSENDPGVYLIKYSEEGLNDLMLNDGYLSKIYRPVFSESYVKNNAQKLCKIFDIKCSEENINKLVAFFKQENQIWLSDNVEENKLTINAAKKFFWLQQLSTEAEQQLTTKENVIHKSNIKQYTIDEILDPTNFDSFYATVQLDQSARRVVGTKRNNALVSSYISMDTTNPFGVTNTSRIAMVQSNKQTLMNTNGQIKEDQDVVDGSILTLGIAANWEEKSYGAKHLEHTKKVIGFIPTKVGLIQIKCADYILDNMRIANSFRENIHEKNYTENAYMRAKKMMQASGKFSKNFYNAYTSTNATKNGVPIHRYIGNVVYKLTNISLVNGNTMRFAWEPETVQEADPMPPVTEIRDIDNVFDLWEALGSYNTVEQQNGEWVTSNASMDYISNAISMYDPNIKKTIISKLIDVSSCKSSITNLNLKEILDDPNESFLNSTEIDNRCWGQQQDYSHESDEAEVPFVTQVGSAISFNGKNVELVGDAYNTMALLTMHNVVKSGLTYKGTKKQQFDFFRKVTTRLMNSLQASTGRSDAITVVRRAADIMQEMAENKEVDFSKVEYADGAVPFSSPDIFYKLASDFITIMNKQSIKQTFPGIAIVQNPSQGQICVYEDNKGQVYTRTAILKMARENLPIEELANVTRDTTGKIIDVTPLSENQIIENYFNSHKANGLFTSQLINTDNGANDFEIEDAYQIVYTDGSIKSGIVENAQDLFILHDEIQNNKLNIERVLKTFGHQRNLKVPNIKFIENGQVKSLWLCNSTRNRISHSKFIIESGKVVENPNQNAILEHEALLWYRADLEGLGSKNPYYYKTVEDWKQKKATYVQKAEYIPGEQILPKVNKTAHKLGAKSLSEIEIQGPSYFEGVVQQQYTRKSRSQQNETTDADNKGILFKEETRSILTAVRDTDEIVYTFIKPRVANLVSNPNIVEVEENEKTVYYYQDDNFQNVFAIPQKEGTSIYVNESGGKTIYYVVNTQQNTSLIESAIDHTENINTLYHDAFGKSEKYNSLLIRHNATFDPRKNIHDQIIKLSKRMFDSFKLSNYTISVRIPSQSFQSFMGNKTVAFTEDNQNNGYININEIWFTGGDFDIDKAYTLMYALDENGIVATTSPLSKLTNLDTLNASMHLPLPNVEKVIQINAESSTGLLESINEALTSDENSNIPSLDSIINDLNDYENSTKQVKALEEIGKVLKLLNSTEGTLSVTEAEYENNKEFINLLNRHNRYKVTEEGLKNRITNILRECAYDPKNFEESSQPMDSSAFNEYIKELEEETQRKVPVYNNMSPFTKYAIQYQNSVGKSNVGIAANGNKAASALQQYYNQEFNAWDGNINTLPQQYELNLDLTFNIKNNDGTSREIFQDSLRSIGDVVFDQDPVKDIEKYTTLHSLEGDTWKETSMFKDIEAFVNAYIENQLPTGRRGKSFVKADGTYLSQYEELKNVFDTYVNMYGLDKTTLNSIISNQENFLKFRYFAKKFNPNVADSLSVMISLATDNAKELALSKINATPELMSMHIALLTLGVHPKTVLDIGMNLLQPIADKLSYNNAQNGSNVNVRKLIESETSYDNETKDSLLKVYDFAQQLRILTQFFKVNQGVTGQYVELLGFCNNLSLSLNRLAKNVGLDGDSKYAPINLFELFNGDTQTVTEYQQQIINAFENLRSGGINTMDVILHNDNFRAMLESMTHTFDVIQNSAAVARFIQMRASKDSKTSYDTSKYRKLIQLYQDFIVNKVLKLKEFQNIRFTVKDLKNSLGVSTLDLPINTTLEFGFDSMTGINNFMHLMDNYVIPKLQEKYKDNFFIKSLNSEYVRSIDKNIWQLKFDVFNDTDVVQQQSIKNATEALKDIQWYNSGLVTTNGAALTIGDALYLYNMIGTKHRMSSTSKVITTVANDAHSKFSKILKDMYTRYDQGILGNVADLSIESIDKEFDSLDLYQQAILNNYQIFRNSRTLDLRGSYIWTAVPITFKSSFDDMIKEVNDSLSGDDSVDYTDPDENNIAHIYVRVGNGNPIDIKLDFKENVFTNWKDFTAETLADIQNRVNNAIAELKFDAQYENLTVNDLVKQHSKLSKNEPFQEILKKIDSKNKINRILKQTTTSSYLLPTQLGYVKDGKNGKKIYITDINAISEYNLLDLFLQTQFDRVPTITEKYALLEEILKDVKTDTKDLKNAYLRYMQEHFSGQEYVDAVITSFDTFQSFLMDQDIYYRETTRLEKSNKKLQYGDIVTFSDVQDLQYIYVGEINGEYVFANIDFTNTLDDVIYKTSNLDNLEMLQRLRVDRNFKLLDVNPTRYNDAVELESTEQKVLDAGDYVYVNDDKYKVYTTLYNSNEDGKVTISYLVKDLNNSLKEIQGTEATSYQEANNKIDSDTSNPIADFSKNGAKETEFFKNLSKMLSKNDIITINGNNIKFEYQIDTNRFIGTNVSGFIDVYYYNDIERVQTERPLVYDGKFESDIKPIRIFAKNINAAFTNPIAIKGRLYGYKLPDTIRTKEGITFSKGKELWRRMDGYEKVSIDTVNIGDIFINEDDNKFYKVLEINKDSTNALCLEKDGNIEFVKIADLVKDNRHYTQDRDIIFTDGVNKQKLNQNDVQMTEIQESNEILDYLKKTFGLQIVEDESLPTEAMIRDNVIYVRDAKNIASASVHEFSHLALATLRMIDPDSYYSMRNNFMNNMIQDMDSAVVDAVMNDNKHYPTTTNKEEELIIRYLDNYRNDINMYSENDLKNYFNKGFERLLGIGTSHSQTESISAVLRRHENGFFEDVVSNIDLLALRREQKMKKIMDNITEIC